MLTPGDAPPRRRLLMTADGVGGVWPYALDLASALATRGFEATLAVMGPSLRVDQRVDARARGIDVVEGGFALEWMDSPWDAVAAAGEWLLELERSLRPEIVHLNGYCHAALPWRAPTVVVGHSCVRSWWRAVHGGEAPPEWDRYATAVAEGLGAASLVVAPTAAMLAALTREYGPLTEAAVIPNGRAGVDNIGGEPPPKAEIVFAAGRVWDEAKNIDALCAVAGSLRWPVYVAGETTVPDGRCVTTGYVNHLGLLPQPMLSEWYRRAAIYALPARYEPFGLSVLEAAAAGCALVLGEIRSLRENWTDAALFVPPDNRRALAAAVRTLIDDPARRAALGRAAMARARRFTVERMADGYVNAYARATALRPAVELTA